MQHARDVWCESPCIHGYIPTYHHPLYTPCIPPGDTMWPGLTFDVTPVPTSDPNPGCRLMAIDLPAEYLVNTLWILDFRFWARTRINVTAFRLISGGKLISKSGVLSARASVLIPWRQKSESYRSAGLQGGEQNDLVGGPGLTWRRLSNLYFPQVTCVATWPIDWTLWSSDDLRIDTISAWRAGSRSQFIESLVIFAVIEFSGFLLFR